MTTKELLPNWVMVGLDSDTFGVAMLIKVN
jgi:hypothetical protein